jgi:hypothetical protein
LEVGRNRRRKKKTEEENSGISYPGFKMEIQLYQWMKN